MWSTFQLIISRNLSPISFGVSNKCYYLNSSCVIVYIKPTKDIAYHITEELIFTMGNLKNLRVFNFATLLKSRKFYAGEIYMFYSIFHTNFTTVNLGLLPCWQLAFGPRPLKEGIWEGYHTASQGKEGRGSSITWTESACGYLVQMFDHTEFQQQLSTVDEWKTDHIGHSNRSARCM